MIQVTKNVFVENEMMACNLGLLVTTEGLVLIDTPMQPSNAVKWRGEAEKRGEIKYLINTEEHPDHWQGSYFFPGILITSQITRTKLGKVPVAVVEENVKQIDPRGVSLMKDYKVRLADITFEEGLTIYLGNHTIRLFSIPGHSTGGAGVYLPEEKVVFTSDTVFHKKKTWLQEADPKAWLESLEKLDRLDIDVVVPGHGDICHKDYFKEQRNIVEKWAEEVQEAMQRGLSAEEAAVRIVPPDPYPKQEGTPMTEAELNKTIVVHLYKYYSH
jgi:cyclase